MKPILIYIYIYIYIYICTERDRERERERKSIKQGEQVGNIQPKCSNLGHSWQGPFVFSKSHRAVCSSMLLAFYRISSGRE